MQRLTMQGSLCLLLLVSVSSTGVATIQRNEPKESPVTKVVTLIEELEAKVKADGKSEQATYDEYACWCEKTLARKAKDISDNKETIEETETLIKKLKSDIASHEAEIEQLEKDIAQNKEAVKEAVAVRDKEYAEYAGEKAESEQCIGALEAAIKVLTEGTKASFLSSSMKEAQLLSIVAGVHSAMSRKASSDKVSGADMQLMQRFLEKPTDFVRPRGMSAAQTGLNPFGDYAPQSTQIQGILKGMYDAFTGDLEKDNAAEAEAQKAFDALWGTKLKELETLEATLEKQETDKAAKDKALSESQTLLDDTKSELKANEEFFADSKAACEAKAKEWSVRTRLRTEELAGMQEALKILSDPEAVKSFGDAFTTLIQVQMTTARWNKFATARSRAYSRLRVLAAKFQDRGMATIAVEAKTAGHFDKVIKMIDEMMVTLRKEEQDDIAHRDRCENAENANSNSIEDLDHEIEKTEASMKRMENTMKDTEGELGKTMQDINNTKTELEELLTFRNEEVVAFKQALKDDSDSIALLKAAVKALTKFYKDNDKFMFAQKDSPNSAPEYTEDPDKAPETWSSEYGGRKSENTGIVAILDMLIEDLGKEMSEARSDDEAAQAKYLEQKDALDATLVSLEDTKVTLEKDIADLKAKINDYDKFKTDKEDDKKGEEEEKDALETDCEWVKSHFETRREKRKAEMDGLVDAKAFLAGVESGNELEELQ